MAVSEAAPDPSAAHARVGSPSPGATRVLLGVCFFVSGGAGLVYEVLWSRHLHGLFGSTTESVAAVLAVFMTGLGLGGHLFGRVADRSRSPMRLYGLLEIGVGLFAVVTPALLGAARLAWLAIAPHVTPAGAGGLAVKLALAALVLVPPATLMGGTLPALVRATAQSADRARAQVGLLYALNTLGAVAGTVGTGFVLIEVLGLSASMQLTAVVNIGIGALVVARARRHGGSGLSSVAPVAPVAPVARDAQERPFAALAAVSSTWTGRYVMAGLFLSGALTMVCEVVFTRALGLVFGVSSYAFTMVLAVFLFGLGLGALAAQRIARRRTPTAADFGACQIAMAAVATVAMLAIPAAPRLLLYARQVPELSFSVVLGVKAVLAICALLPLALVAGLGTPLLLGAITGGHDVRRAGRLIGDGYMLNTAGTLVGSLAAGFVLIERLGTQGTLRAAIVVTALTGLLGLLPRIALSEAEAGRGDGPGEPQPPPARPRRAPFAGRLLAAVAALVIALVALGGARWPTSTFLVSDSRLHHIATTRLQLEQRLQNSPSEILSFAEGREATVAVTSSGERALISNGHPDASDRSDMSTQLLLGLVSVAVHPAPRQVLVVGFGSGVTADAAARTPGVEQVEVVELERAILDASPAFHHVNHAVENNPRVRLVQDDARSFLGYTPGRYDVIVSEPSNPWRAGVASLFSADFYRTAAATLRPGGLFTQWMHLYALTPQTLRLILATLMSVFPEVQVWWLDEGNIALVASAAPLPVGLARLRDVLGAGGPFAADIKRHARLADPDELLGRFLLDTAGARAFASAGEAGEALDGPAPSLHTDDLPILEFEAPRGLFAPEAYNGLRLLAAGLERGTRPPVTLPAGVLFPEAERWAGVARLYLEAHQPAEARAAIERALAIERSPHLVSLAAAMAQQAGETPRCEALLEEARAASAASAGDSGGAGATAAGATLLAELAETTARLRRGQRRFDEALGAFDAAGGLDGRLGVERLGVLVALRRAEDGMAQAERSLAAARPGAEVEAIEVEQVYRGLVELARAGTVDPLRAAALIESQEVPGLPRFPRDKALATLMELARRPSEALDLARRALARGVVDGKLLEIVARALLALGRIEEAAEVEQERRRLGIEPEMVRSPLLGERR